jgi:hypothetical protein
LGVLPREGVFAKKPLSQAHFHGKIAFRNFAAPAAAGVSSRRAAHAD